MDAPRRHCPARDKATGAASEGGAHAPPPFDPAGLDGAGGVAGGCLRLASVSEADWRCLEAVLEDAGLRCSADTAALRGKVRVGRHVGDGHFGTCTTQKSCYRKMHVWALFYVSRLYVHLFYTTSLAGLGGLWHDV
jgi:hypothetical protein